jgi:hypothetical protein
MKGRRLCSPEISIVGIKALRTVVLVGHPQATLSRHETASSELDRARGTRWAERVFVWKRDTESSGLPHF